MEAICQILLWETVNESFNANPLLLAISPIINNDNKALIADNIDIIKRQFEDNTTLKTISTESKLLLTIIAKTCASCITNKSAESLFTKIKDFFIRNDGIWYLNKKAEKYSSIVNYIFTNNANVASAGEKITAAQIILFGIVTFKTHLQKILDNFLSSNLFHNAIKTISTSMYPLNTHILEVDKMTKLIAQYQKATKHSFDTITTGLGINLDYSQVKIAPGLQATPWYLSTKFITLTSVASGPVAGALTAYNKFEKLTDLTNTLKTDHQNNNANTSDIPHTINSDAIFTHLSSKHAAILALFGIGIITATGKYGYSQYQRARNDTEAKALYTAIENFENKVTQPSPIASEEKKLLDLELEQAKSEEKKLLDLELEQAKKDYIQIVFYGKKNQKIYNNLTPEQQNDYINFRLTPDVENIPKSLQGMDLKFLMGKIKKTITRGRH